MATDIGMDDLAPHEIFDLRGELFSLPNDTRRKFGKLLDAYEDVQVLEDALDEVQEALNEAREEAAKLEEKMTGLEADTDELRLSVKAKEEQISELEGRIDEFRAEKEAIREATIAELIEAAKALMTKPRLVKR